MKSLPESITNKHDVQSSLFGNRFVVKQGNNYHVARLNKGGSGHYNARVGKTAYGGLDQAVRAIGGELPAAMPKNEQVALIEGYLPAHNAVVVSDLYESEFVVGRISPRRGWQYFIGKIGSNGISELAKPFENALDALAVIHSTQGDEPTARLGKLALFREPRENAHV